MDELFSDHHWRLHRDGDLLHLHRTRERVTSLEAYETELKALRAIMEGLDATMGIVMDMRDAVPRNDEAFEAMTGPYRKFFRTYFARCAVVLRTEVGKLNFQRLDRRDDTTTHMFTSMDEAVAWAGAR